MSPEEFRARWSSPLFKIAADDRASAALPAEAIRFLSEAGLPRSASPGLSFAATLHTVAEAVGVDDADGIDLRELWKIGTTSTGDPVAVDPEGVVWALNHDDGFTPYCLASSLPRLAAVLVAFAEYSRRLEADDGTPAHDVLNEWLDAELDAIVPASTSFWSDQMEPSPSDLRYYDEVVAGIHAADDDIDAVLDKIDTLPPEVF